MTLHIEGFEEEENITPTAKGLSGQVLGVPDQLVETDSEFFSDVPHVVEFEGLLAVHACLETGLRDPGACLQFVSGPAVLHQEAGDSFAGAFVEVAWRVNHQRLLVAVNWLVRVLPSDRANTQGHLGAPQITPNSPLVLLVKHAFVAVSVQWEAVGPEGLCGHELADAFDGRR